jgi:hypothetical protein
MRRISRCLGTPHTSELLACGDGEDANRSAATCPSHSARRDMVRPRDFSLRRFVLTLGLLLSGLAVTSPTPLPGGNATPSAPDTGLANDNAA